MDDNQLAIPGNQQPREAVLVLVHPDRFVEVYAGKHVDVIVRDVPRVSTPAAEILAEEYMDLTLPIRYRNLHWPDLRRAMHVPRTVTAETIARRACVIELLQAIQAIAPTVERATWTF